MRCITLFLLRRRIRAKESWRRDLIDGVATGQVLLRQCNESLDQLRAQEALLMPYRQILKRAIQ